MFDLFVIGFQRLWSSVGFYEPVIMLYLPHKSLSIFPPKVITFSSFYLIVCVSVTPLPLP